MLTHRINFLPRVEESLPRLAKTYKLVLISKGDPLHQEKKLVQSGSKRCLKNVRIVS